MQCQKFEFPIFHWKKETIVDFKTFYSVCNPFFFPVKSVTCNFDDPSMCGYLMVDSWKRTQHQNNSNGKIFLKV